MAPACHHCHVLNRIVGGERERLGSRGSGIGATPSQQSQGPTKRGYSITLHHHASQLTQAAHTACLARDPTILSVLLVPQPPAFRRKRTTTIMPHFHQSPMHNTHKQINTTATSKPAGTLLNRCWATEPRITWKATSERRDERHIRCDELL